MKAPETLQDFTNLINGMVHRERFVFNNPTPDPDGEDCLCEIYAATIWGSPLGEDSMNITTTFTDNTGKCARGGMRIAKLRKLWRCKYDGKTWYERVFIMITEGTEKKGKKK